MKHPLSLLLSAALLFSCGGDDSRCVCVGEVIPGCVDECTDTTEQATNGAPQAAASAPPAGGEGGDGTSGAAGLGGSGGGSP